MTEKAFPEDETVISTGINVQGTPGNESHIIHELRFGVNNQIEVDVPIQFQDQNHVWYGGVGDATLAVKRVMYSNLVSGSILSVQGGLLIPSGNRSRGFGSGTTTFETFTAFDQVFRSDTFIQTQYKYRPSGENTRRVDMGLILPAGVHSMAGKMAVLRIELPSPSSFRGYTEKLPPV